MQLIFQESVGTQSMSSSGMQSLTVPAMGYWNFWMLHLGGGRMPSPFDIEFFTWWERQVILIEDYPYASIDYRHDPDMVVPPGCTQGVIG